MKNENNLLIIALIILGFFLIGSFGFGGMHQDYGMMGSYWTSGYGFMGIFMTIIWILFIILMVLGIIYLTKKIKKK